MTETAAADRIHRHGPSFGLLVILLLVLTALRYWGLMVSQVELMFDEAQYWSWSLDPAWGYFSKPPLIAWLIGGENLVCGTSEFCARSFIPAIHFGTALVIYALARRAVSPVVGFWSALVFATLSGIAVSHDPETIKAWTKATGLTRRVGLYLQHPKLGGDMLALAGSDELTVAWTREHHLGADEWTIDPELAEALHDADDD